MGVRILFTGLMASAIIFGACSSSMATILFEDDFDGTTLDTSKWYASGTGTVIVSGGNVTLDVPTGDWAYSQIDSTSTWTAASDLYYSFMIGAEAEGNYNIIQVFEGTAQTGYVALRNDLGDGEWWFDVREGETGTASYRGKEQPDAVAQTLSVGDIITLKLGPTGSAAYKNGVMFDTTTLVPLGTLMVDAQCWREPGGVASQAFDSISVSDTAPTLVPGDANNDGKVDGSDVTILAGNWQYGVTGGGATWDMGDFNSDGKVDGSDVTILAGNWQYGVSATVATVPEPGMLALLLGAIVTLFVGHRVQRS